MRDPVYFLPPPLLLREPVLTLLAILTPGLMLALALQHLSRRGNNQKNATNNENLTWLLSSVGGQM